MHSNSITCICVHCKGALEVHARGCSWWGLELAKMCPVQWVTRYTYHLFMWFTDCPLDMYMYTVSSKICHVNLQLVLWCRRALNTYFSMLYKNLEQQNNESWLLLHMWVLDMYSTILLMFISTAWLYKHLHYDKHPFWLLYCQYLGTSGAYSKSHTCTYLFMNSCAEWSLTL